MLITHLKLKNWRNFTRADVGLQQRQFIVGPNASGKSNLLDVFRFLRDIAKQRGGGLQEAIAKRGGMTKIRCLSARRDPEIIVGVSLSDSIEDTPPKWRYEIGIKQEQRGFRQPILSYEKVWNRRGEQILDRPNEEDKQDSERLKQTYLEQVNNNQKFREIGKFFDKTTYMHLVPQLLRYAGEIQGRILKDDPFGQDFLERIATSNDKQRKSRFKVINDIIKIAVPKLTKIDFERDSKLGKPHITALYSHWRKDAGKQREDQFSDGTLRLIALIWYLLEDDSLLLLEEPELSLHTGIVESLAGFLFQAQQQKNRQVIVGTHSAELLSDTGIGGEEVLMLTPGKEGTQVEVASKPEYIAGLLREGLSVGEVVLPSTRPEDIEQLGI